jgi:GcrA cell cycle regulator
MSAHASHPGAPGKPFPPGTPRKPTHIWTDDDDERLAALWDEGLPSTAIARRMATTKGSVLGRAHRLELAKRPNPSKPAPDANAARAAERLREMTRRLAKAATPLPIQAAPEPAAIQQPPQPETPPEPNVVPVEAVSCFPPNPEATNNNRHECQFPLGHPKRPGFRFCLANPEPAKPYCLAHCRIAYIGFRRSPPDNPFIHWR